MSASMPLIYEELVVFPTSMIKSPGSLLRKSKTEDYPSFQRSSDSLHCESTPVSTDHILISKTPEVVKPRETQQLKLTDYNSEFKSFFGSSLTSFALNCIMEELNLLPQSFTIKLQMKVILTDHPTSHEEKHCMRTADLKNKNKVQARLYYIMFHSLLSQVPNLLSLWEGLNNQQTNENQYAFYEVNELLLEARKKALEDSFYAIMFNKAHSNGLDIVKLKELLMILDPASFTVEWFKNHNKELKKACRVRFDDEDSE